MHRQSLRRIAAFALISLVVAFAACSGPESTPTPSPTPRPPVEGQLGRSEVLTFWDAVTVTFEGVSVDRRCPQGVECVRAGEAFVQMSLTLDDGEPVDATLVIEPGGETWTWYAGYLVTLTALEPDPPPQRAEGEQIDYTAHIRIEESDRP